MASDIKPPVMKQGKDPAYKYARTKTTESGYQQDEFKQTRGGNSLYKEGFKGEPRGKSYTGEAGGWNLAPAYKHTSMNYYHEDD